MRAVLPALVAAARPSSSNWARACHRQQECTSIISMEEADEIIVNYHQVTKHALSRYARGPHGLDWANQPNPFRRYRGARLVLLDHVPPGDDDPLYPAVFQLNGIAPKPVTKRTISQLLYDSLALSAWKSAGASTWSLRVNPSSGNLHPTEGYAISGPISGVCECPFVGHYAPKEHALEIRAELPLETWKELTSGFPPGSLFIAFSSIFWREAWKYGERAFRYCNHDVGHAMGAVAIAAATLGWKSMLIDTWSTHELQLLLGLSEEKPVLSSSGTGAVKGRFPELEQEHADCIMVLFPNDSSVSPTLCPSEELIRHLSELSWKGKANSLSREHVRWDMIYRVAQAAKKPSSAGLASPEIYGKQLSPGDASVYKGTTVRQVVRRRRSAVSMDGQYGMQKEAFYQILVKTMGALPFSTMPWKPEVNMVLFVHRVVGISQGIYILVRNPLHEEALRRALRSEFKWQKPPACPPELPLYILAVGDCRVIAERLSCHQDIAGDGCFSLGMVARFEDCMRENGAWMYPRLFWEAGVLGQLLYLEAHAMGISATGIGCYFDDAVHEVLGIRDKQFQSLYHFTVGVPVVDKRIMSLPAYPGPLSSRDDDA